MRISSFSFLLYSLSLVAVTSGQSALVSDVGNIVNSGSASASPTETSTTESATDTSTTESSSATPTEVSTSSTTTDSSSSSSPTTDSTTDSTTTTSSPDATTTTDSSSTGTTTSDHTTAAPSTITTIHTISGTPMPTTMTSAADTGSTSSPTLSTSSKDSSDSGLSSHDKKVIIGVVVGVGGALIIGVLGVVIWRIRSKKGGRNDSDEAADLMSGTAVGTGNREKAPSPGAAGNSGTPFRSTLDQYHNPGHVNAASNF